MIIKNHSKVLQTTQKIAQKVKPIAVVVMLGLVTTPAFARINIDGFVPSGWIHKTTRNNMAVYQKHPETYSNAKTYVNVVDIASGAKVRLMQWRQTETEKQFAQAHTYKYWINDTNTWKSEFERNSINGAIPQTIINGAFFMHGVTNLTQPNPTHISFPLVVDGKNMENGESTNRLLSAGADLRIMKFDSSNPGKNYPRVSKFSWGVLLTDDVKNAIVGYNPFTTTGMHPGWRIERTYLCVANLSGKKLLITYSSTFKTRDEVVADLRKWKCSDDSMVMLDGSDSMQFHSIGVDTIYNGRRVPQVIGLFDNGYVVFRLTY